MARPRVHKHAGVFYAGQGGVAEQALRVQRDPVPN